MNADSFYWRLSAFIRGSNIPCILLANLGVLGGPNETTLQVRWFGAIFFFSSAKLL
jgi:hypothetical protein